MAKELCSPSKEIQSGVSLLALGTGCMFSRAWQRLHVFPLFVPVACFPVLGRDRLHVFARVLVWVVWGARGSSTELLCSLLLLYKINVKYQCQ